MQRPVLAENHRKSPCRINLESVRISVVVRTITENMSITGTAKPILTLSDRFTQTPDVSVVQQNHVLPPLRLFP